MLLALLKQVPLYTEIQVLMQHWFYFYERSIGCVGVLKDWLVRAVAAALHDGSDTLTWERLREHALTLAQCERMAIDTTEGEQKLGYMESRHEHLWQLLQLGMSSTSIPTAVTTVPVSNQSLSLATTSPKEVVDEPKKTTRSKRSDKTTAQSVVPTQSAEIPQEPVSKKKRTRKKEQEVPSAQAEALPITQLPVLEAADKTESTFEEQPPPTKKPSRRVGQRKPQRDPVGDCVKPNGD